MDTLRVLDDCGVGWLKLSGIGNETAAHVRVTGWMTLMFCAFEGDVLILRLYGQGQVYHPRDAEWQDLVAAFPDIASSRQIFDLTIDLVQTSCGTGVLFMEHRGPRADTELVPFYAEMGEKGVEAYWRRKNVMSIDGKATGVGGGRRLKAEL